MDDATSRPGRRWSKASEPCETAAQLWALMQMAPDSAFQWDQLSRFIAGHDDETQIQVWRSLLAAHPDDLRIHANLERLLYRAHRGREALVHLRVLAAAQPDHLPTLETLARRTRKTRSVVEEVLAWNRVLRVEPGHQAAHMHLASLFEAGGRPDKALPHLEAILASGGPTVRERLVRCLSAMGSFKQVEVHLTALAEAPTATIRDWKRLGRCLMLLQRTKRAAVVWRRVLKLEKTDLEAIEQLERIDHEAQRTQVKRPARAPKPLRISILGNCQAYGLSQCLRRLCPDADIDGFIWPEIGSVLSDEAIARRLEDRDLVISQLAQKPYHGALRTEALAPRVNSYALFPNIHFTGFHPDLLQLTGSGPRSALRHRFGGWHSALVLGAFLRGLPEGRTAELFNAYIYGALGYFDEYAKAELHHLHASRAIDIDLEPELAKWRRDGAFVHVPNHPVVGVFWSMAEMISRKLGLETRAAEGPPPDRLRAYDHWPVYPEIARRLGVEGELQFRRPGGRGEAAGLDKLIRELYRVYARTDPAVLRTPRIAEVEQILKREGL